MPPWSRASPCWFTVRVEALARSRSRSPRASVRRVTASSGAANGDRLRSIGADDVLDSSRDDFTRGARRYDVIIDIAGTRPLKAGLAALTEHGRYVIVGGPTGRWIKPLDRIVAAVVRRKLCHQRDHQLPRPTSDRGLRGPARSAGGGDARSGHRRHVPVARRRRRDPLRGGAQGVRQGRHHRLTSAFTPALTRRGGCDGTDCPPMLRRATTRVRQPTDSGEAQMSAAATNRRNDASSPRGRPRSSASAPWSAPGSSRSSARPARSPARRSGSRSCWPAASRRCRATPSRKLGARFRRPAACSSTSTRATATGHVATVTAWLDYIVNIIVTAMVAVSFGSYATSALAEQRRRRRSRSSRSRSSS